MIFVKYNQKWYKVKSERELIKLLQKEIEELENLKKAVVEVELCSDRKKVLTLRDCEDGKLMLLSSFFAKLTVESFLKNIKKKVYFVLDSRRPAIGYIENEEFFDLDGNKVKILDSL